MGALTLAEVSALAAGEGVSIAVEGQSIRCRAARGVRPSNELQAALLAFKAGLLAKAATPEPPPPKESDRRESAPVPGECEICRHWLVSGREGRMRCQRKKKLFLPGCVHWEGFDGQGPLNPPPSPRCIACRSCVWDYSPEVSN